MISGNPRQLTADSVINGVDHATFDDFIGLNCGGGNDTVGADYALIDAAFNGQGPALRPLGRNRMN